MSLLGCRDLTRRPWFEHRDLDVQPGEIVFLSGPTGSGKTLFLRTLADLDPADDGTVTLDGRERSTFRPAEWRRAVLYVHQSAPRLPGTVADNLARITALGHRADGPVDSLGLEPGADAGRLSGGEAQLLAIARALAVGPRVFLLDESTSAMDTETRTRIEERIRRAVAEGRSALWVSHDDGAPARLGARVERFP